MASNIRKSISVSKTFRKKSKTKKRKARAVNGQ